MLKVYNTSSKKVEKFVPIKKGEVRMYVCGPTVNGIPHLGHARQQITFDILRKYLIQRKYKVKFVSNITDIEDKIIEKAKEEGISVEDLSKKNMAAHKKDYEAIGINPPDVQPKATEYVKEMIDLVRILDKKGYAYVIEGDGVYYDISKFKGYGKLSGQDVKKLRAGARIKIKDKKRNKEDFVLWKFSKEGEPKWESPWGKGRPGWHIECSAMSKKILGLPLDIHGGGQDLIFPHHEDEVAQSEAAYGKTLANYWMHNGMVNVENVKMSKSLGNFKTIQDLLKKYSGEVIRYFVLSGHYRKPIDFSTQALEGAKSAYERLKNILENIKSDGKINKEYFEEYQKSMDEDLNTPAALAVLWKLVRDKDAKGKYKTIEEIDRVFGLKLFEKKKVRVPKEVKKLLEEREKARKEKNWSLADKKRDEISRFGFVIEDNPNGARVRRK